MITERLLVQIWQNSIGKRLFTPEGRDLKVIYPGRRNNWGPDFSGAILNIDGKEIKGDVEVHLKSGQWQKHGHHLNPSFDGVVLHLVFWDDVPSKITTIPLSLLPEVLLWAEAVCGEVNGEDLEGWGRERFLSKARGFETQLKEEDPEQVLYKGIMVALGYSQNSEGMKKLAEILPFSFLQDLIQNLGQEEALFLLKSIFGEVAKEIKWQRGNTRPANCPQRRLEAAIHLIYHYKGGLVKGLRERLKEGVKGVERGLIIPYLLGRDRAGEIAINIILPFFFALGEKRAEELYQEYPPLRENSITLLMRRKLRIKGEVNSARRQQGLIYIYKSFCQKGGCGYCPAKRYLQ